MDHTVVGVRKRKRQSAGKKNGGEVIPAATNLAVFHQV